MGNFINAGINAGKFFINKSKLQNNKASHYIEVFDKDGVSLGTCNVWRSQKQDGTEYFSGDLSFVVRDEDKEPYRLPTRDVPRDVEPKKVKAPRKISGDPHEGTDKPVTPF